MTAEKIEKLFKEVLNAEVKHGQTLESRVPGLTRNMVFNWRNNRTKPSLGDMLNVLFQLGEIEVVKTNILREKNKIDFTKKKINTITGYVI